MDNELRREIILDNYEHPYHKETPSNINDYIKVNSNNESCIDNIDIYIKINNDIIEDVYFDGEACAISTSAASIMIKLIQNKTIEEVITLINNYENMIEEKEYDKDILKEALVYDEIYKQQNRKHCALLPWNGLKEALTKIN